MSIYTRGIHSVPAVPVTDEQGVQWNAQAIAGAQAVPENGSFTVWVWRKGSTGRRFSSGLSESAANTLASSLVSRVA